MHNPFGAILASTKKASPPGSKARGGGAGGAGGGGGAVAPSGAKAGVAAAARPAAAGAPKTGTKAKSASPTTALAAARKPSHKMVEIKSVLTKLETLTGGRLSSKELFQKFVAASRESATAGLPSNFCAGLENLNPRERNVVVSDEGGPRGAAAKSAARVTHSPPGAEHGVGETEEEDDLFDFSGLGFGLSPEPARQSAVAGETRQQQQRPSRYSLGVSRFSLPGRLSIDTRRMSLSEVGKSGLSPRRVLGSLRILAGGEAAQTSTEVLDSSNGADEGGNFLEFCVAGVDRAILSGFEPPRRASLQPAQLLDVFSSRGSCATAAAAVGAPAAAAAAAAATATSTSIIESIADYCFPSGVGLQLVSGKAAIERLVQAPPRDAFHVLQFMDATGKPTYAACLTVCELQEAPNDLVIENLIELRAMERAAAVIRRFLLRIAGGSLCRKPAPMSLPQQTPQKSHSAAAAGAGSSLVNRMVAWSARKTPAVGNHSGMPPPTVGAPTPTTTTHASSLLQRLGSIHGKPELPHPPRAGDQSTTGRGCRLDSAMHGVASLPTPERLMYNPLGLAEFFSDENSYSEDEDDDDDDDDDSDEDDRVAGGTSQTRKRGSKASGAGLKENIGVKPFQPRTRRSSSASSAAAAAAAITAPIGTTPAEKHMILTQRAYCIVATKPLHTFFFKVLEAVAHKERSATFRGRSGIAGHKQPPPSASILRASALLSLQVQEYSRQRSASAASTSSGFGGGSGGSGGGGGTAAARLRSESTTSTASASSTSSLAALSSFGAGGIIADAVFFSRKARRDRFLAQMQALPLAADAEDGVVIVSCPSYIKSFRIESRTTTLAEWTTATLFCTLPAPVVVQVLSLLLLEKSLVIYGSDLGLVSAVGTAFTQLLRPFSWQGVFVPVLPLSALEVLEAPVPFIVGVAASLGMPAPHEISSAAAVLHIDDFLLEHDGGGGGGGGGGGPASRRRVQRRRLLVVPTDDACAALADPVQSSELASLVKEIDALAVQLRLGKRAPSLRTASTQLVSFMLGMTPAEKRVVNSLAGAVEAHNAQLLGQGMHAAGGWRKYGIFNDSSNSWEFIPELLIGPMRTRLSFQEGVAHTQLFVSYLDQLKAAEEAAALAGDD